MAINLEWVKCEGNVWCDLLALNLDHEHFENLEGVYLIWHGGQNPATVRVGQGIIRDRLAAHRQDPDVLAYEEYTLCVTWARVAANRRDGVERYLAETLSPKVGAHFPDVEPLEVNLPW